LGRYKREETITIRLPKRLRDYLKSKGNVRELIVEACKKVYGYKSLEKKVKEDE
jgi:hypothetical protein